MAYLLDANVFIEAKNRYYGLDFCPAFREWLITENAKQRVISIERVGDEIASPSIKKIKIPNVCIGLGIKCVTPFEMLRIERARFVLGGRR